MRGLLAHMGMALEIGIYLGTHDGMRRVLFKQIARRFGNVPPTIRQKIEEITDTKRLDRIAVELLKVENLKQLNQVVTHHQREDFW